MDTSAGSFGNEMLHKILQVYKLSKTHFEPNADKKHIYTVRSSSQAKNNLFLYMSETKQTSRQCIYIFPLLWSECSGLCAVTFFFCCHSALLSLSHLMISPKHRVLCVLFFGIGGGNWRGREEQRRASETWENEMRWLFILPAKATYLFRVALERGLKQHQRPCTQITRLGLYGRMEECSSH